MSWLRNLARTFIGFTYRNTNRVASAVLTRTGLGQHLVAHMARTGAGTDACYRAGCLPMPVHFYSPVPDLDDLEKRQVWTKRSELPGIDWQPDAQAARLRELGTSYGAECDWPLRGDPDGAAFFVDNGRFSFGCAAATHCLLRALKPRRVIEVGSGMSTRVIGAALLRNKADGHPAEYTVIDPHPASATRHVPGITTFTQQRVELLSPTAFEGLGENDVLFIDSGHTVRIGGDVNFLYLDVVPRLRPGVVVHSHDIPLPYEYPKVYAANPAFRVFWTESYLLQAFLCHNDEFEVLLGMTFLTTDRRDDFRAAFPRSVQFDHLPGSSSFWYRRKPAPAPHELRTRGSD